MARASLLATAVTLFVLATPASGRQAEAQVGASRGWAYALALQRDGKLVAAGRSVDGGWRFAVARYTTRGRLDPGFGQGGKILTAVGSSGSASELAIQRDGKLVAAGQAYVGPEQDVAVVRYTSRGRLDTSFGRGGAVVTDFSARTKTYDYATGLALQRDGKLVVNVSSVKASEDSARRVLARYTARGQLDRSFGRSGKVVGRAGALERSGGVALQGDGKIVASGTGRSGFVL